MAVMAGALLAWRLQRAPDEFEQLQSRCEQGDAPSCATLGARLVSGEGVAKDFARGLTLLHQSCELGFAAGCYLHGYHLVDAPLEHAEQQAMVSFDLSCSLNYADGCAMRGWLFRHAKSIPHDLKAGVRDLTSACAQGSRV